MRREARNVGILGLIATTLLTAGLARAQAGEPEATPMQAPAPIRTLDDLVRLSAPQLDQLYAQAEPGPVPTGKVVGRALYPDARFPRARSNAARFAWQGKVFDPSTSTATNRFFGVKAIKGNVYIGPSWSDGQPSMILDYEDTSRIYGNYRDEIRQVAPGLYLGLMYDRTTSPPTLKMYFAFDARP
jgi:hypothetical protein